MVPPQGLGRVPPLKLKILSVRVPRGWGMVPPGGLGIFAADTAQIPQLLVCGKNLWPRKQFNSNRELNSVKDLINKMNLER